jgi:hypothetical protein
VLQLVKVVEFPPDIGQLLSQAPLHRRTRLQAAASQPQEPSNLAEFESQALDSTDKTQRFDIAFAVLAEASLRPWRPQEQGIALVEANCVNAQPDPFCDDANLHYLGSSLKNYTLECSPESRPYSFLLWKDRVLSAGLAFHLLTLPA